MIIICSASHLRYFLFKTFGKLGEWRWSIIYGHYTAFIKPLYGHNTAFMRPLYGLRMTGSKFFRMTGKNNSSNIEFNAASIRPL